MTTDESGVRITQREVYDKVLAVDDAVSKMSTLLETHIELTKQNQASTEARLGSIDSRLEAHSSRLSQHDSSLLTHDGRIGAVEKRMEEQRKAKTPWYTIVTVVIGIVGGAGTLITTLVALGNFSAALAQFAGN